MYFWIQRKTITARDSSKELSPNPKIPYLIILFVLFIPGRDEEYDETDDEYEDSEKCLYVVLHAYTAEQEEDLSIEVDDIVLVLQKQ